MLALGLGCSVADVEPEPAAEPEILPRSFGGDSMWLHWNMEDRTGNRLHDLSGNGHHGIVEGGTFVDSPWGEALSLDGVDDYVSFNGRFTPIFVGDGVTISARVRVDDVSQYNSLCTGCGTVESLSVGTSDQGDRVRVEPFVPSAGGGPTLSTAGAVADDTWTQITVVVRQSSTRIYVDCELDSVGDGGSLMVTEEHGSFVGHEDFDRWFGGEIDDLRIWNDALSSAEIAASACEEVVDLPCSGAPEAAALGIGMPQPPTPYSVPSCDEPGVTCVTPETLATEFDWNSPTIVFADGDYYSDDLPESDLPTQLFYNQEFLWIRGQTLLAQNLGGAVLHFGVEAGSGSNPLSAGSTIQGLVFDVDDRSSVVEPPECDCNDPEVDTEAECGCKCGSVCEESGVNCVCERAPGHAIISTYGFGTGLTVEDVVINGHGVLDTGILAAATDNLVIRRTEISELRRFGISAAKGIAQPAATEPLEIQDVYVHGIFDSDEATTSTAATTGAGLRVGEVGTVSDIRVRDTEHSGILVFGHAQDVVVQRVDVDRIAAGERSAGVAVYLDNVARGTTVQDFCVGPGARIGVNGEHDHCGTQPNCTEPVQGPPFPRTIDTVVRNGVIEANWLGVGFDQGTVNGTIEDVVLRNYGRAGILMFNNSESEEAWPTYSPNGSSYSGVTFDGLEEPPGRRCHVTLSQQNAEPFVCEELQPEKGE